MLGHLDPEFLAMLDETCDRLRTVFGTANALTLPISGTGSAGMEASFVNVVNPGDVVVVGVNGVFGQRMTDVAARCGAEVVRVEAEWGRPIDPEALAAAHPNPKVIAVVHAETSTGVRSDIAPFATSRATRCCSSIASRRSEASPSRSTTGASTSRTAARRSASVCRPASRP